MSYIPGTRLDGAPITLARDPGVRSQEPTCARPDPSFRWQDASRRRRGLSLEGAVVVVTGGGSGIGRALCLEAARRGAARVHVWDLDGAAARSVTAEVEALGPAADGTVVDVTDATAVLQAAHRAGRVDVVVNNAGVVTGRRFLEATEQEIRRTYEVNALAPYWVTRAFLPAMVDRDHGAVVTVASAAGLVGVARQTDYAGSKHAAVGFADALRAELRRDGSAVSSHVVCPFYVDTGMFAGVRTRVPALLPILRPEQVAASTWDAVERGRARVLTPPLVHTVEPLRLLPASAFDAVVDLLGVNRGMDRFVGRGGSADGDCPRSGPAR